MQWKWNARSATRSVGFKLPGSCLNGGHEASSSSSSSSASFAAVRRKKKKKKNTHTRYRAPPYSSWSGCKSMARVFALSLVESVKQLALAPTAHCIIWWPPVCVLQPVSARAPFFLTIPTLFYFLKASFPFHYNTERRDSSSSVCSSPTPPPPLLLMTFCYLQIA